MNTKKELKKSIVFVVLAVSLLFLAVPMASASDWGYKKAIEIDHTKVAGDLTNFPVLISMTDDDLRDDAQDTGNDIMFTDSSLNPLAHEIEYFNGTTGELQAWVKVTSLSSASTTIHMYYGNATCGSQENVADVWDSHFKMVQHLNETTGMHYDSTANDNDGAPTGVTQDAIGKIDGADDFGGSDDHVDCGNATSLNITGGITVEAWVKPDTLAGWSEIISKRDNNNLTNYDLRFGSSTGSAPFTKVQFYWGHGLVPNQENWNVYSTDSTYTTGQWYYIVATREGTDRPKIYVNGAIVEGACTYGDCTRDMIANTNDVNIGAGITGGTPDWVFNGTIDEVRISDTARSADWINTSYNNQNDPSSFTTVGDEQTTDPGIPEFPTMSLPVLITIAAVFLMYRRKQRQ
ncbi:Concanavalin A-like lectin [Candidatus Methanophagaceae archaeon]|nr:Concanavalin A-like lectin [Methanophagales archaeon]